MCGNFDKPCKLYKSMKRMLMMWLMAIVIVSCSAKGQSNEDREPTREEIKAELTKKARESIADYCKHLYRDYQPMEWFNLYGDQAIYNEEIKEKHIKTLELRDSLLAVNPNPRLDDPGYKEYSNAYSDFLESYRDYEPELYSMGHAFSHDTYIGRKVELFYFIMLPPDMKVISKYEEQPEIYIPVLIDLGGL